MAAFEQSLVDVSQKLQKLSVSTDQKEKYLPPQDNEIQEMKQTIELLRQQSAGIAATQLLALSASHGPGSTGGSANQPPKGKPVPPPPHTEIRRHRSTDSMYSASSNGATSYSNSDKQKKKSGIRHSLTRAFSRSSKEPKVKREPSKPSRSCSQSSAREHDFRQDKKRHHSRDRGCASPPPLSPTKSTSSSSISPEQEGEQLYDLDGNPIVERLVSQLRQKDMVLTDIRLEALTTASQVENLKDTVMKMRQEMMHLKQNNERLQQIVTRRSITGSDLSLGSTSPTSSNGESRRYSAAADYLSCRPPLDLPLGLEECEEDSVPPAPAPEPPPEPLSPAFIADLSPSIERNSVIDDILEISQDELPDNIEGKKVAIAVYLGQMEHFSKYLDDMNENGHQENGKIKQNEFTIAFTYICGKTSWQNLDYIVWRSFKDFLERVDPTGSLGLNTESIASYHLGEAKRSHKLHLPELLPCGYIVGNIDTLYICLRGVSNVALDNLIIKNMVLRYKSSAVSDSKRTNGRGSSESVDN